MSDLSAVILAAGQGKRMKSALPKVLHAAAGRPLVYYPLKVARELGVRRVVLVVSPSTEVPIREVVANAFPELDVVTTIQDPPRGTGDAARVGLAAVETRRVLIMCADTPLLRLEDVARLVQALDQRQEVPLAFLSCLVDEPHGYGRVLRDSAGNVLGIVEHRDLQGPEQLAVREVNAGVYAGVSAELCAALERLTPNNAQGEYYLTDVVADLGQSQRVLAFEGDSSALLGVNDRAQLNHAERLLWARKASELGQQGVTIRGEVYVDESVSVEPDATLEPGVRLRGATCIGAGAFVDVGCVITDSRVLPGAKLLPYSVLTESEMGEQAQVGPFTHMRPGSALEATSKLGNFVETKNARLRRGAKANHLAYIGDADVGEKVNIGAGTIVCNYDGFQKHQTQIGEGTFIGSDSQLIAPLTIGRNAYVATGTSVTQDVPDNALAIGRSRQTNKQGYAEKLRARLRAAAGK